MKENIEFVLKFFEEQVNRDDTSRYSEFVSEDILVHGPASDQKIQGLATVTRIDASYSRAYPQKKFDIEEVIAQGDKVILRWVCQGSYKEDLKGMGCCKSSFEVAGISIYRIENGKIAEIWQSWDRLGLLEQMGEISVRRDTVEPGYYRDLLKSLGMEKYLENASFLTLRERQCLLCLLDGKTAKETAQLYQISHRTVESYYEKLKEKLNCLTKRDLFTVGQILQKLDLL